MALPISLSLLLTNQRIQKFLVTEATSYLSDYTGGTFQINHIAYNPLKAL